MRGLCYLQDAERGLLPPDEAKTQLDHVGTPVTCLPETSRREESEARLYGGRGGRHAAEAARFK